MYGEPNLSRLALKPEIIHPIKLLRRFNAATVIFDKDLEVAPTLRFPLFLLDSKDSIIDKSVAQPASCDISLSPDKPVIDLK